jgi:hypothetical protein
MDKNEYLNKNIFYGLKNVNDGFDAEIIKYFSETDFQIVLNRVEKLGIGVLGIEPWKNGEFYDVKTYEEYATNPTDSKWYQQAFDDFKKRDSDLQYAATYSMPE